MTSATTTDTRIERIRRTVSFINLGAIAAALAGGLALSVAGQHATAVRVYTLASALLLVTPVTGVVAALIEEISRRDWLFATAALGVLVLIAYQLFALVL
jgi:drug/metabolite transporter (DMT)-like permease